MPTYESLPAPSDNFKGKLYHQLVDDLRLAGKAKRTVYGYVRAVRKLADHHQKTPDKITEQDVRDFLLHQIVDRELAAGTQSVLLSGLKFFYRTTFPRKWKVLDQTKINYGSALPEVITQPQVFQIIDACRTLRLKTLVWTTYTLGLRISEATHLQVGDLDSQRMMVHVHRGKGAKDRYLPLPQATLQALRAYSVTDQRVTYRVKPSGKRVYTTRHLSGEAFVRAFAHHILPPGLQKVRYYGFMSPNSKLKLATARWLSWQWKGWNALYLSKLLPPIELPEPRRPRCERCDGELKLIRITGPHGELIWRRNTRNRGPPKDTLHAPRQRGIAS